jgi:HSP20 family protein
MQDRTIDDATQGIPVKVYRSDERVTIAAPMPGLEPSDINVKVGMAADGPLVLLHGALRGELKDSNDVLLDEWTPGPYHREVVLADEVDGEHANVTYANGVLVVALPLSERTTAADLTLDQVSPGKGQRVGNRGKQSNGST